MLLIFMLNKLILNIQTMLVTCIWSPMLMIKVFGMGFRATQAPSRRTWRPGTWSWRRRVMRLGSVWPGKPQVSSGCGHGGQQLRAMCWPWLPIELVMESFGNPKLSEMASSRFSVNSLTLVQYSATSFLHDISEAKMILQQKRMYIF